MALVNKDFITPAEASGIVLGAYQGVTTNLPFASILPDMDNPTGLSLSWTPNQPRFEIGEMEFSAYDAEAPYDETKGGGKRSYTEMLPLRKRHRVSEEDIMKGVASPAFTVDAENNVVATQSAADNLREAFVRLGKELAFTVDRYRSEAVVNGKIEPKPGSNNDVGWDYGRDASLTVSLSATKTWDKQGDPVVDIRNWTDAIDDNDGDLPTILVTTRKVWRAMTANKNLIKYFYSTTAADNLPSLLRDDELTKVLTTMTDIRDVVIIDELYRNYARQQGIELPGKVKSFFPEDTVLLLPALGDTSMGYTAFGPTAQAREKAVYGITRTYDAGPVGVVLDSAGSNPGYEALINATALPVVIKSNSTFKATVTSSTASSTASSTTDATASSTTDATAGSGSKK